MKVIFLDIDGVLLPWEHDESRISDFSAQLQVLARICNETGAQLVLSSDWRYLADKRAMDELKTELARYNMSIMDCTNVFAEVYDDQARYREISYYISTHNVDNFVVLDDYWDMFTIESHMVRTHSYIGLTEENGNAAIEILNAPQNKDEWILANTPYTLFMEV